MISAVEYVIITIVAINALLAQLDRVFGYEPKGQGFESLTARHETVPAFVGAVFLIKIRKAILNLLKEIII